MGVAVGLGPGQRAPLPRAKGDAAVQAETGLHDDPRQAGGTVLDEGAVQFPALFLEHAAAHRHPPTTQVVSPAAGDPGVGVGHADHHRADPGGEHRLGAGSGSTGMIARFQGDIQGGAVRPGTGVAQGMHLGVGGSGAVMVAPADNLPARLDDHRAHRRVGRGPALALARLSQRQTHVICVVSFHSFPPVQCLPRSPRKSFNSSMNSFTSLNWRYTEANRT